MSIIRPRLAASIHPKPSFLMRPLVMAVALLCAWIVQFVQPAWAGPVTGVNPNPMDVVCMGDKFGTITIQDYYGWMSNGADPTVYKPKNPYPGSGFAEPRRAKNRDGAYMNAIFTPTMKCPGYQFQWVQGVVAGKGTIGPPPYLDPFNRDDNLPFYWTTPEANDPKLGKNNNISGTRFADIPSQSNANKGNSITFEADLVAYKGMNIYYLKGFDWGYSIDKDGNTVLSPFAWRTGMSQTVKDLINNWASKKNPPYLPEKGQKPDGWKVLPGCPACPEPSSILLMVLGLSVMGITGLRQSRQGQVA